MFMTKSALWTQCPKAVAAALWALTAAGSFPPALCKPPVQVRSQAREVRPLVQYVDPFIGVRGAGECVVGPQLPFGSVNPSPDTPNATCGGYSPSQPIRGFSQTHVRVTAVGTLLQVFVDDMNDPKAWAATTDFEQGTVGVRTWNTPAVVENIRVSVRSAPAQ